MCKHAGFAGIQCAVIIKRQRRLNTVAASGFAPVEGSVSGAHGSF